MKGGRIRVHGNAGPDLGARMRRGTIAVSGDAGDRAGVQGIAGTILVLGRVGRAPGFGLKRASLIAPGPLDLLPTFRFACEYRPGFVPLLLASLKRAGFDAGRLASGRFRRHVGDCADLGRGEILEWTA
jgi:formylmethanofuran dehydrogenase subunit C